MIHSRPLLIVLALVGLVAASLLPAGAQTPDQAPGAPAQSASGPEIAQVRDAQQTTEGGALQEVVVTAERRATNLQTTPISVEAISANTLESQNEVSITNLQLTVPGFQGNTTGLYVLANVRGIGSDGATGTSPTGVAVIKDGLFAPEIHQLSDPFFDMSDVEVLRGPQGTFVGYSSDGGAIELNTANPNFNGINGYVEFKLGNYSDEQANGAFNDAITDTFAVRLAFNEEIMGSFYRDNGAITGQGANAPQLDPGQTDDKDFRISGLWKPTNNFQALLKFENNNANNGGTANEPNQVPYTLPPGAVATGCPSALATGGVGPAGPGGTCYSQFYPYSTHIPFVLNYTADQDHALIALNQPFHDWRDGLELRWTLPGGTVFRSLTGFQTTQYDQVNDNCDCSYPGATGTYNYIPPDDYYSQEFNLISPTRGNVNWIVGATWFYRNTAIDLTGLTSTPPYSPTFPQVIQINDDLLNRIAGVFGQVNWQFVRTLQLEVGLRENWDNNYTRGPVDQLELPPTSHIPPSTCTEGPPFIAGYGCIALPVREGFKDTVPTGKVTLNWTPLPGQFFYGFFAHGYKSGGATAGQIGTVGTVTPFQPEKINDWELGWKTTALGGHLLGSLGGYYMIYQNMQQQLYDARTGTSGITVNLPPSTLDGLETDWNLRQGGFGLIENAAFEKSKLGSIAATPATYALPPAATSAAQCTGPGGTVAGPGQTKCFNYAPYDVNISGEAEPYAPEFTSTTTLDYRVPLAGGTLDPKIQFAYTSKQYTSLFEIPYYEMGARHLWNAYLTYDKGAWDAEFYYTNFTNQVYLNGNSGTLVYYGNPMQFGVRFRRDF